MAKKASKLKKLHKKEEKLHHTAERAMKKDEKVHEKIEKMEESPKKAARKAKITKVMREFKDNELHSGSKTGPKVTKRDQAIAIALSEAKKLKKKKNK